MTGTTSELERQIRERGPVLDMAFTQALYEPLLRRRAPGAEVVQRDLPYGADPRQRFDAYLPAASATPTGATPPRTMMIFFPGGGFIRGDKADKSNVGRRFAAAGLVTLIANYRLAPTHTWPAGAEDVIAMHACALERAAQFGADPLRVFLVGESAGAAHVAAATLMRRFQRAGGLKIAGAALVSGVYNVQLEKLARRQFGVPTPDPRNDAYFGTDAGRYPQMSTVELIDAEPLPLLITYAELDLLQMQVQACELFARLVTRHGFAPSLQVIHGHNHLSQTFSMGTGDERLSTPLLEFMESS